MILAGVETASNPLMENDQPIARLVKHVVCAWQGIEGAFVNLLSS